MGTTTFEMLTSEQARSERESLLHQLGLSMDEARDLEADYSLTPSQLVLWRRIQDLTWLLGE